MDKIFELKIDLEDLESGVETISLVAKPAIEINWLAFNKEHTCNHFNSNELDLKYVKMFDGFGESEEELLKDGWVVVSKEPIKLEEFGLAPTKPNAESDQDTEEIKVRYKYDLNPDIKQNPIIPTTREYCRTLLTKNFVFRKEEIESLPPNSDPDDGGWGGNALTYRGNFQCRHWWYKMTYKKDSKIVNKASINIGKVKDDAGRAIESNPDWDQPDLVTQKTKDAVANGTAAPTTAKNLGLSKFEIDNDEKRIIISPAMIPDMKIFRGKIGDKDKYVYFSKETIRMIAEKYMKNGYNTANDTDHNNKPLKDIYVIESWIKESELDKSSQYEQFKELPIGTWFVTMKINSDDVWKRVKKHELNGVSVSGFFQEELVQMEKEEMFLDELVNLFKMVK